MANTRVPGRRDEDQAAAELAERNDEEQDRRLHELVQELRLLLPATTVLFGFLLSVPFSSRFDSLSSTDRVVHFCAFVSSALALVFLLAEAGYHRLRGRPYDKDVMIRTTSRQAVMGLALLGTSLLAVRRVRRRPRVRRSRRIGGVGPDRPRRGRDVVRAASTPAVPG